MSPCAAASPTVAGVRAAGGAEDFPQPPGVLLQHPALRETPSRRPGQRTRWNVRDSNATLILAPSAAPLTRGTAFTLACATALGVLILSSILATLAAGARRGYG